MEFYVIELVLSVRSDDDGSHIPDEKIPIGYVKADSLDAACEKSGIDKLAYDKDDRSFLLKLPRIPEEKWVFLYKIPEILSIGDLKKRIRKSEKN